MCKVSVLCDIVTRIFPLLDDALEEDENESKVDLCTPEHLHRLYVFGEILNFPLNSRF